jgi:hypothetical protein
MHLKLAVTTLYNASEFYLETGKRDRLVFGHPETAKVDCPALFSVLHEKNRRHAQDVMELPIEVRMILHGNVIE